MKPVVVAVVVVVVVASPIFDRTPLLVFPPPFPFSHLPRRADSTLYNLILQSRRAVKGADFTSHVETRDFTHDPSECRGRGKTSRPVALPTSRRWQYSARESFHSNLTGMHVCTCREYKACENLSRSLPQYIRLRWPSRIFPGIVEGNKGEIRENRLDDFFLDVVVYVYIRGNMVIIKMRFFFCFIEVKKWKKKIGMVR